MSNSRGKFTCPNTDTEPHHEQMHEYMVTGSGNGNGMGIRMGTVTGSGKEDVDTCIDMGMRPGLRTDERVWQHHGPHTELCVVHTYDGRM